MLKRSALTALIAATGIALLAGCRSSPGVLASAQSNTLFAAANDSTHLVMSMDGGRGAEIRTLRYRPSPGHPGLRLTVDSHDWRASKRSLCRL